MVAYSFKRQFVERILAGEKRQTIRRRRDRQTLPGDQLQLYFGMRTQKCSKILDAKCISVTPLVIDVRSHSLSIFADAIPVSDMEAFARQDGFRTADEMHAFWFKTYGPGKFEDFELIQWDAS